MGLLRLGVASCAWRAAEVADGGIDRVHYSHCRQELRIVVVERGGDWDPATSALPALAGRYGLRRDDGTYSYRRAYARYLEDDAAACAASHHPFGEEFEPKFRAPADRGGCYVAAAVEAAWAGAGAYALSLALPEPGRSYAVNVLGGFDGCAEPLEALDAARFAADEATWANRSAPAAPCAGYARGDAATGPVLASFEVPADALHAAPRRTRCRFESIRGAYAWRRPHNHSARFLGVDACAPLEDRGGAPFCAGDVKRASMAAVGDSNTGYVLWFGGLGACVPRDRFSRLGATTPGATLAEKLEASLAPTAGDSVAFLYVGAHFAGHSPAEIRAAVAAALAATAGSRACYIVSMALDVQHENIPRKWSPTQKFFRSSWRVAMQNDAVRAAVADAARPRVHFLDLFGPSLPLHFDAHRRSSDPVHFRSQAYRLFGDASLLAASELCGIGNDA